jgi:hypothetical protein
LTKVLQLSRFIFGQPPSIDAHPAADVVR